MNNQPTPATKQHRMTIAAAVALVLMLLASACGSDPAESVAPVAAAATDTAEAEPAATAIATTAPVAATAEPATAEPATAEPATAEPATAEPAETLDATNDQAEVTATTARFQAEVWADNWFALYANGILVGEDSVPITTERSFNAERIEFEATLPLTIAVEGKDFKETDSGIEYIGANNQQMGDGGLIAQITNLDTGEVIAVTDGSWRVQVIHRAPLNTECERSADPNTECQFEITTPDSAWARVDFDDSGWALATEWSEADVSPKDGYDQISWTANAALIWGTDLEVDNTVLFRTAVG